MRTFHHRIHRLTKLLLGPVCLLLAASQVPAAQVLAQTPNYKIFLPSSLKPQSEFLGVQVNQISNKTVNAKAQQAGSKWYRTTAFRWDQVEPSQGQRLWSTVDEQGLADAASRGQQIIATVFGAPSWARNDPHVCAAIKPEAFNSFAAFLTDLVRRYSAAPYSIRYWELGNEPDVDPSQVSLDSVYGCWGDQNDTDYFGGDHYGEMLKVAYPAIKAADPSAQVMIGGLLLDCDPTDTDHYSDGTPHCANPAPAHFFNGILAAGGPFDLVSFHGYPQYAQNDNPIYSETSFGAWDKYGGVVMGKVDYLREMMKPYLLNKPIFLTEAALTCKYDEKQSPYCANPGPDYQQAKASYLVWLYVRNWAEGIAGTTWFTLDGPGWRSSGLLDAVQNDLPAYTAVKVLNQTLNQATVIGKVTNHPGLVGYVFSVFGKRVEVVASPDKAAHALTLAANQKAYDIYRAALATGGSTIQVRAPVYIETVP